MGDILDVSDEYFLLPFKNGIKLAQPDCNTCSTTVQEILTYPFNIYFYNQENIHVRMNEANAQSFGFDSPFSRYPRKIEDLPLSKQAINDLINNNQHVIAKQAKLFTENEVVGNHSLTFKTLTVKVPLYNSQGLLGGIFGCSTVLGVQGIASSIEMMAAIGLFNITSEKNENHNPLIQALTLREQRVLEKVIKGYTAREIAAIFGISKRTVEQYIDILKTKLMVSSKNEIIKKFSGVNIVF